MVHSAEGSGRHGRGRCIGQESPLCSDDDAAVAGREPGLDGVGAAAHPVSFPSAQILRPRGDDRRSVDARRTWTAASD
jgi:hypothetical protein